jgi:hypothetical protein
MRTNEPKPVMIMERGQREFIHEAKCKAFECSQDLPEAIKVLLCLIDGAERRHRLMMRWSGSARESVL